MADKDDIPKVWEILETMRDNNARVGWGHSVDGLKDKFKNLAKETNSKYQIRKTRKKMMDDIANVVEECAELLGIDFEEDIEELKKQIFGVIIPDLFPDDRLSVLEHFGQEIEVGQSAMTGGWAIINEGRTFKTNAQFGLATKKVRDNIRGIHYRTKRVRRRTGRTKSFHVKTIKCGRVTNSGIYCWKHSGSALTQAIINYGHLVFIHSAINAQIKGTSSLVKIASKVMPGEQVGAGLVTALGKFNAHLNDLLFRLTLTLWSHKEKIIIERALRQPTSLTRPDLVRCPYLSAYILYHYYEDFGIRHSTFKSMEDRLTTLMDDSFMSITEYGGTSGGSNSASSSGSTTVTGSSTGASTTASASSSDGIRNRSLSRSASRSGSRSWSGSGSGTGD